MKVTHDTLLHLLSAAAPQESVASPVMCSTIYDFSFLLSSSSYLSLTLLMVASQSAFWSGLDALHEAPQLCDFLSCMTLWHGARSPTAAC
jgi:hypothetical protein